MLPLTILVPQKVADLLTSGANGLPEQITALASSCGFIIPIISPSQVVLSATSPTIGDKDAQLSYPRICLYSSALKNTQVEKFRSLSGYVSVVADVWASANLVNDAERWIHFYVEVMSDILQKNIGDWGDGIFFAGVYEVQFQAPAVGGLGYVQSAKVTYNFTVSRN